MEQQRAIDSPTSDDIKTASPFPAKKSHEYGVPFAFIATHVKRIENSGVPVWEFTNGTGHDIKVSKKFDYNVWVSLSDDIKNMPPQVRQECDLTLIWEWQPARGKQTQDTLKVVKVKPHSKSEFVERLETLQAK